jgi:hypothetical protein
MQYHPASTDDEIAAALAAVRCYIEQRAHEQAIEAPARPWNAAAAIEAQGLPPTRNGQYRAWGTVDRAGRTGRWSHGIIGL